MKKVIKFLVDETGEFLYIMSNVFRIPWRKEEYEYLEEDKKDD